MTISFKLKSIIFAGLLSIGFITNLTAQTTDKYEFAIISYAPVFKNITISTDAPSYTLIEVKEDIKINDRNLTPVLTEIKKLQDDGWELFDTEASGMGVAGSSDSNIGNYLFYMRKKK